MVKTMEMMVEQPKPFLSSGAERERSAWDEELPRLTKRQIEVLIEVAAVFDEEEYIDLVDAEDRKDAIRSIYCFLREHATRKEAHLIMRYPDLVWKYYNTCYNTEWDWVDPDEPDPMKIEMRRRVRELTREAVRRLRSKEAWYKYKECLTWENVARFLPAPSEEGYGHYERD
jgi:hypothetical protein